MSIDESTSNMQPPTGNPYAIAATKQHDPERLVSVAAAVVVFVSVFLPWYTVSMPFFGSMSFSGTDTDIWGPFMVGAGVLGAFGAFANNRIATAVTSIVGFLGYLYVWLYFFGAMGSMKQSKASDSEFTQGLNNAISGSPGIGLIIGTLTTISLAVWLIYRQTQATK